MPTRERGYIRIEAPRLPEFVAVLRRAMDVVAARAGLPREALSDLRQALGEACGQAVSAAPYAGGDDLLRLSCSHHPPEDGGRPAIHLFLDAPQALFFPDGPPPLPGAVPPVPGDEAGAPVPFATSLISQLMENVACHHTARGTAVSFVCHYTPRD